jgi:hypothetical protein
VELGDLTVELFADPRDLGHGDPLNPQSADQIVDLPSGDDFDVGLQDRRRHRCSARRRGSKERRERTARGDLGDSQLDGAHSRVPAARPIPVAMAGPFLAALVAVSADRRRHLRVRQQLSQQADPLAQHIRLVLAEKVEVDQ